MSSPCTHSSRKTELCGSHPLNRTDLSFLLFCDCCVSGYIPSSKGKGCEAKKVNPTLKFLTIARQDSLQSFLLPFLSDPQVCWPVGVLLEAGLLSRTTQYYPCFPPPIPSQRQSLALPKSLSKHIKAFQAEAMVTFSHCL